MALPPGPKPKPDSEPRARECDYGVPAAYGPYVITYYWSDATSRSRRRSTSRR